MTSDIGTLVTHWVAVGGTTFLAFGSGIQAYSNVATYSDELGELQVPQELKNLLPSVLHPARALFFGVQAMFAARRIITNYRTMKEKDKKKAQRVRELALAVTGWLYVLYGSVAVLAVGAVQLAVDYGA